MVFKQRSKKRPDMYDQDFFSGLARQSGPRSKSKARFPERIIGGPFFSQASPAFSMLANPSVADLNTGFRWRRVVARYHLKHFKRGGNKNPGVVSFCRAAKRVPHRDVRRRPELWPDYSDFFFFCRRGKILALLRKQRAKPSSVPFF